MTLSFSQFIDGRPTYFVEKIWWGLIQEGLSNFTECNQYQKQHISRFGTYWPLEPVESIEKRNKPKTFTIRQDPTNRWKPGMDVHPVINNRSSKRFQFAPTLKLVAKQEVIISREIVKGSTWSCVKIGEAIFQDRSEHVDTMLSAHRIQELATLDGFDTVNDFFDFFSQGQTEFVFEGYFLHWTTKIIR